MQLDTSDDQGHVLYRRFGRRGSDEPPFPDAADELAKLRTAALDSITLRLALREQYETIYDVCDHNAPDLSPLALVEMHKKERIMPYGRYDYLARMFFLYEIKDAFGYNFSEFLELTRVEVEHLMEVASSRKSRRDKLSTTLERNLQQATKSLGE